MAQLTAKRDAYRLELVAARLRVQDLRKKLTKEKKREHYFNRCIKSLNARIGDIKEGQLEFTIEGNDV